jgi:hypothetical protein
MKIIYNVSKKISHPNNYIESNEKEYKNYPYWYIIYLNESKRI